MCGIVGILSNKEVTPTILDVSKNLNIEDMIVQE